MKKRLLTLFVAVFVVVCAFVVTAPTADAATASALTGNVTNKTISTDTVLDLNGYNIGTLTVSNGAVVTLKDSQTDDYNATNGRTYGKITTINGTVKAADGYLLITEGGVTSAHKLNLTVSGVVLRATELETAGASVYYQCTFGGDEVVKRNIAAYGVAMGANRQPDFSNKTFTRTDDLSAWTTGATFADNSILLKGIMKQTNVYSINKRNGSMDVYCQAYVELTGGSRVTGPCVNYSLKDIVQGADVLTGVEEKWDELSAVQKTAAQNLYNTFTAVVNTWSVPKLRQSITGGAYQIWIPKDLELLNEKSSASYILTQNLDMTGVDYTPISNFSGTFNGNGKTISNLVVDTAEGDNIGMFTIVAAGGTVQNLHLENITVNAQDTTARFIGTLAGRNNGTIKNCTVTGTINDDQEGDASRLIFVGALAGRAGDNSVTTGGTGLSVVDRVTNVNGKTVTYTTTGLTAKVKMNVPDSQYVMRRLIGNYSATNVTYSGDWQDLSFSTEDDSALVQTRRRTAEAAMREMGTFKWTVPTTLIHYGTTDSAKKETHIHTQKFYPGTTYYGIPYDHTSSSFEQAMAYMDEGSNGIYVLNDKAASSGNTTWGETVKDSFGNSVLNGFTQYIGNDCSGAVAWAWQHAVPRWVGGGGVHVLYSANMMPNDAAETTYGIFRVGPYTVTDDMTEDIDGTAVVTTPAVATANGMAKMYESYARTQMGDGLVYGKPGGHVRMAAADSVVIRNAIGSIYGNKSYILVHEQGDGLYDRATTNSSWRINYQYTFNELYNGTTSPKKSSGKGYLPVTLQAYHDETVSVLSSIPYEYIKTDVEGITTPALGQINAGNRILSATVTVKDSSGKVVYQKTAFKGETGISAEFRSTYLTMIMKYYFSDYVDYVTSGKTYTFSVDCTVAGGTLNADGTISNYTANVIKNRSFTAA